MYCTKFNLYLHKIDVLGRINLSKTCKISLKNVELREFKNLVFDSTQN